MLKEILFLALCCLTHSYVNNHCNTLHCMSKQQYIDEIKSLKSQLAAHDLYQNPDFWKQFKKPKASTSAQRATAGKALIEQHDISDHSYTSSRPYQPSTTIAPPEDCTICRSKPCLNGGVCVPDEINKFTNYTCVCPYNYNGENCENELKCDPNPCGVNATCSISNNQINCVCQRGLSGDPWQGCTLVAKTSCLSADPHYVTFDGLLYDYMGTCPYTFSTACSGSLPGGYSPFSARVRNSLVAPNSSVSYVNEAEIDMYGQTVHIQYEPKKVFFNRQLISAPFRWPNVTNTLLSIDYDGSKFYVTNAETVQLTFEGSVVCLRVPDIPEFQGTDALCGSAGNLDGNPNDDIATVNGTFLQDYSDINTMLQMIDTWRVPLEQWMYEAPYDDPSCLSGYAMHQIGGCRNNQTHAKEVCLPIRQAAGGTGIFAECKDMGWALIMKYYDDCVMDVCNDATYLCTEFTQFYSKCQELLPDTNIPDWREDTKCEITCPVHSHYSSCKSACPGTCASHTNTKCDKGYLDGCECDPNYVVDMAHLEQLTCILVTGCGSHDIWLTDNCTTWNTCSNGTHVEKPNQCGIDAQCSILGGIMTCTCEKGYQGDGYNCTDINECLDPSVCGQSEGRGTCTNLPGSYKCTCNDWFNGTNCQNYKPRRHCADLQLYEGYTDSGVYAIYPSGQNSESVEVICDMSIEGGGWTVISQVADNNANFFSKKLMADYKQGFGSARDGSVWLGLNSLQAITAGASMSLRINVEQCDNNNNPVASYCTYPQFAVDEQTRVLIPQKCDGTFNAPQDPWAVWNLTLPGPVFSAPDNDTTGACTEYFQNTGFWFYKRSPVDICGPANLNGVRYSCTNQPPTDVLPTYLRFNSNPLQNAQLLLRPTSYPNYDPFKPPIASTPAPEVSTPVPAP